MARDHRDATGALRTALYNRHVAAGARMVDFAGWDMPIQYGGILSEHRAVRSSVGVFDLSHMGRVFFQGEGAADLVQRLTTNDVSRLHPGRAQYSLLCADDGRILDDVVVYNLGHEYLMVVNASNRAKVLKWIAEFQAGAHAVRDVDVQDSTFRTAMIGYQGPDSEATLQPLVEAPLGELRYYAVVMTAVGGAEALVSRTGYTGEDGFEIIVWAKDGEATWDRLLEERDGVRPVACGLGARDTLRLEAGMALYGHEIDESTNPFEAGLERVVKLDKGWFVSQAALREIQRRGVERRLIGFELADGGVPRQGYPILRDGTTVGHVTSGTLSPTLGKPIGMGYVPTGLAQVDTDLAIEIRGRAVPAKVVPLPFYQHRTKRAGRAAPPGA